MVSRNPGLKLLATVYSIQLSEGPTQVKRGSARRRFVHVSQYGRHVAFLQRAATPFKHEMKRQVFSSARVESGLHARAFAWPYTKHVDLNSLSGIAPFTIPFEGKGLGSKGYKM